MVGTVKQPYKPNTVEEKLDRKNEMKARRTLLMALPNKDQLKIIKHKSKSTKCGFCILQQHNKHKQQNEVDNAAYGVSIAHTQENLEQIDSDDLEGMDLKWEMAMLTIKARRDREYGRKTIPVENLIKNVLITQDGIGGYDWSYQAEEEHSTNFAFMALTSSGSSSNLDSEVDSCFKTCLKAYATLKEQYDSFSSD
nr:hypothetical protein [Tanacetum cinerariifolium]